MHGTMRCRHGFGRRGLRRRGAAAASREGMAMLVVMLLLLIVTSTAVFAVHSTSTEIRAAGYARQRMQTRYLAEGALAAAMSQVEFQGPDVMREALVRSTSDALRGTSSGMRYLAPEEPPMATDRANYRIDATSFVGAAGIEGPPIETAAGRESFGGGLGFTPQYVIDINDEFRFTGVVAGQRSDGNGTLEYVAATYTARGFARPPADRYSPLAPADPADPRRRGYHETVSNARAIGVSGPTRRR